MADHPSPLRQMSGSMSDEFLTRIERTIQGAIEPLQARIEELERRVDDLTQETQGSGSRQSE